MFLKSFENNKAYPILVLMLLAIIWGSSFILIKKGLIAFSALQVGTIRVGFAFLILLPFALKKLNPVFRLRWKTFLLYGIVANLLPAILFALAETGLSSSLTGILNSLTPIFTLMVGLLFFKIGMQKGQTIGLALGLTGSVLISFIGAEGGIGHFNYFVIFVVVATILYGFAANMVRNFFIDTNSLTLTSLAFFSIGPVSLITLFSTDFLYVMANAENAWSSLSYLFILSAVGTAFALILFNKLIQMTSAVFGSTVTYLIPIAAIVWGIMDGESLFPLHFVGVALIVGGVYIVNKFK
jgi:drug/metabolite transporter (DMT)-like permease